MRLRDVGVEESARLAALHATAFPPAEQWGEVAIRSMLEMRDSFGILAGDEAGEAGFILARAMVGEAEILTLAVRPERRREGVGAALLGAAAVAAAARGAEALFLEVSERNAAARALYAGAGCAEVGRRKRYYADGSDALVLRLGLGLASGG